MFLLRADQLAVLHNCGLGGALNQLNLNDWYNRVTGRVSWNLGLWADPNFTAYLSDVYSQGLSEHGLRTESLTELAGRGSLMPSSLIRSEHQDQDSYEMGVTPTSRSGCERDGSISSISSISPQVGKTSLSIHYCPMNIYFGWASEIVTFP